MESAPDGAGPSTPTGAAPGIVDRLTRRSSIRRVLLAILVVALLPLVAIAAWQGLSQLAGSRERHQARLADAARLSALPGQNSASDAYSLLMLLARDPDVRSAVQDRCQPRLADAANTFPGISAVALLDRDGKIICSSTGEGLGRQLPDSASWERVKAGRFELSPATWGLLSRRNVIPARLPVVDGDGAVVGALQASIDLREEERLFRLRHQTTDVTVALIDGDGRPVASTQPLPWSRISPASDGSAASDIRTVADGSGRLFDVAAAPLMIRDGLPSAYSILFVAESPRLFGPDWVRSAVILLLPLVALLLASLAIWIGANRAILRWVGALGDMAADIGRGEQRSREETFAYAPTEIRALAAQLQRMGRTIAERDRTLTDALAEQRRLALELHHRVRNNLQIVGSFLRLQAITLENDPASRALDQASLRVAALGLVHRLLYDSGEMTAISTEALLGPLCDLIVGTEDEFGGPAIGCDIVDLPISIDAAVPLSLWLVEAAALATGAAGQGRPRVTEIDLRAAGDDLELRLVAEDVGLPPGRQAERLMSGMARQLGGESRTAVDGLRLHCQLRFPRTALAGKALHPHRREQAPLGPVEEAMSFGGADPC